MKRKYSTHKYDKKYYRLNNKRLTEKIRERNKNLRNAIFEILGRKCIQCGFTDIRALQIDHVNGGGIEERKSGGLIMHSRILKKLAVGSKDYQILCANCNWIKRYTNNEFYSKL